MERKAPNLVHVDDNLPGIIRKRRGKGWIYLDARGERVTDPAEVARLNAIALPPAYTDTWYCPAPNGHILATGIDGKGRKQYRYYPDFRAEREGEKFDRCAQFGRLLPLVRVRVEEELACRALTRDRCIASIVRLLDTGGIRIGNEAYAQANNSFGATTLRMRHAEVTGQVLRLRFRAKSGKEREMRVTDRGLVRFVRKMKDLPGQHLFQYRLRLSRRFGRGECLAARRHGRGLHREAFPHVACECVGLCYPRKCEGSHAAESAA